MSLAEGVTVAGLGLFFAGMGLKIYGVKTNNPTIASIGDWTMTAGIFLAPMGLAAASTVEAPLALKLLVGALPGLARLGWQALVKQTAAMAGEAAKSLSIAAGLPQLLISAEGSAPLAGRIIQRPGRERWWEVGQMSLTGQSFQPGINLLLQDDIVFDYNVVDETSGKAIVTVSKLVNGNTGELKVLGNYAIDSGTLSGVKWRRSTDPLFHEEVIAN